FLEQASNRGGGGGQGMPGMGSGGGFPGGGQGMPGMGSGGGFPGGGQGMPGMQSGGGFPGGGQGMARGGAKTPGGEGQRGGQQRVIPKDEQDRMLFDGQSGAFFFYLIEKVGLDRVRELIRFAIAGGESRNFVMAPEMLGSDFEAIEADWTEWVNSLKPQTNFGWMQ
ncbi:MAG TPA: hypothetical protein VLL97_00610, partial [Acidobacteriota bacterium]|nr:hypothetical protein [Acidobacteriota bacterium]